MLGNDKVVNRWGRYGAAAVARKSGDVTVKTRQHEKNLGGCA